MLIAMSTDAVRCFSLSIDTDPKAVFSMGVIDVFVRAWIRDSATSFIRDESVQGGARGSIGIHRMNVDTVRFGVTSWTGLVDAHGTEIPCERSLIDTPVGKRLALTDASMNRLHPDWITTLAKEINEDNTLSGDDKKN